MGNFFSRKCDTSDNINVEFKLTKIAILGKEFSFLFQMRYFSKKCCILDIDEKVLKCVTLTSKIIDIEGIAKKKSQSVQILMYLNL